ncbi:MAG: cell division topological specificity factor MinE [Beijerinckiaceae bacterium]
MKILNIFRRNNSGTVARERLQILLTHERRSGCSPELVALIHREVLAAIAKHVDIDPDKVEVEIQHRDKVSYLEVNLEIPAGERARAA